jgi:hypothetical protein
MERLIERMLTLHASSGTFRQTFELHQTTQLFIDSYNGMVEILTRRLANDLDSHYVNGWNIRILEKLSHFGLALALDNALGGLQKQEVRPRIIFPWNNSAIFILLFLFHRSLIRFVQLRQ